MKKVLLFTISILFALTLMAQKSLPEMFHGSNNRPKTGIFKANAQQGMVKMDSMVQMLDLGDGFQEFYIASFTYNDNGLLTQNIEYQADWETGEMLPDYNYNYFYDDENRIAELNYEWDTTTNDWQYDDSTYYTYTGGLITQEDFFWYDEANSEWDHDFITYYYYTASMLDSVLETQWNGSGYDPSEITKYTYNGDNVAEEIVQYWDGSQWINDDKIVYTWDGEQLSEYIEMFYNTESSQWVNNYKCTYTWEANGNLNEQIDYEWDAELSQWEELSKLDGVYDNTVAREDMVLPFNEGEEGNPLLFFAHKVDSVTIYQVDTVQNWVPFAKMSFHYSNFVGIFETQENAFSQLSIYPNPAKNQITIKSPFDEPVNADICDASGRIVNSFYLTDTNTINIEDLSPGMYFINVRNTTKAIKAQKFIVQ